MDNVETIEIGPSNMICDISFLTNIEGGVMVMYISCKFSTRVENLDEDKDFIFVKKGKNKILFEDGAILKGSSEYERIISFLKRNKIRFETVEVP